METQAEIEDKIKKVKPYLQDQFGVDKIGYFGSLARGEFNKESDIDILVSFSKRIGWKFFDLKEYLEYLTGRKIDLVTERSLKKQWKNDIMKEVKYL